MRIRLRRGNLDGGANFVIGSMSRGKLCIFGRNFEWQSSRKIFIESERPLSFSELRRVENTFQAERPTCVTILI